MVRSWTCIKFVRQTCSKGEILLLITCSVEWVLFKPKQVKESNPGRPRRAKSKSYLYYLQVDSLERCVILAFFRSIASSAVCEFKALQANVNNEILQEFFKLNKITFTHSAEFTGLTRPTCCTDMHIYPKNECWCQFQELPATLCIQLNMFLEKNEHIWIFCSFVNCMHMCFYEIIFLLQVIENDYSLLQCQVWPQHSSM